MVDIGVGVCGRRIQHGASGFGAVEVAARAVENLGHILQSADAVHLGDGGAAAVACPDVGAVGAR
ncbi:Uncharacterised protein [Mycobacteroides abscessus subsp. massiliense]|nr:Uncharacterised protein [Mycobacteroides abscessus subsp. massiliense]